MWRPPDPSCSLVHGSSAKRWERRWDERICPFPEAQKRADEITDTRKAQTSRCNMVPLPPTDASARLVRRDRRNAFYPGGTRDEAVPGKVLSFAVKQTAGMGDLDNKTRVRTSRK